MVEWVLDWCEKGFFPKVTLVVDPDSESEIRTFVNNYQTKLQTGSSSNYKEEIYSSEINVIVLNKSDKNGHILYHIYRNGIGDFDNFIILPCDFITDLPPQVLIENYRNKNDNDIGVVVHYKNTLEIEDKKNKVFPPSYTVYNESNNILLDLYQKEDIDFHKSLKIRTQMCWRYPNSVVSTKLLNSAIFFGSTKIFQVFEQEPKFNEAYFNNHCVTKVIRDLARRSWKHSTLLDTIGLHIIPEVATFLRINNNHVWMEANRYQMQQNVKAIISNGGAPNQPKDKLAANIGIDSTIGENTTLGERTSVKKTVIGDNCVVGKRVKLTGTLIMNNVVLEDDIQLENCIIGNDVKIHSKTKLVNCFVESTHEVANNTVSKGETLYSLSLEGLVYDISDTSGSDSEESSDDEIEYGDNSDGLFDY